jgi:hypothetical protein
MLVVLMLVCAFGLFAQIPAGTKSVAVLSGSVGDLLADDFEYSIDLNGGYFIIDGLEIDVILSMLGTTVEGVDMYFGAGLGFLYHFPISPMFGLYGGAAFLYTTQDVMVDEDGVPTLKESTMDIPIEVGLELFITPNNAIRLANVLDISLIGEDLSDYITLGTVHYFQ